jgi:hypothetical protein
LNLEGRIKALQMEIEYQRAQVSKKESVLKEYDTILEEGLKAYEKVHLNLLGVILPRSQGVHITLRGPLTLRMNSFTKS